jgi:hypothetical protein
MYFQCATLIRLHLACCLARSGLGDKKSSINVARFPKCHDMQENRIVFYFWSAFILPPWERPVSSPPTTGNNHGLFSSVMVEVRLSWRWGSQLVCIWHSFVVFISPWMRAGYALLLWCSSGHGHVKSVCACLVFPFLLVF